MADNDLFSAVVYIKEKLHEPEAARRLYEAASKEISGLCERPERFPLVRDAYWADRGVRWFPVKNYRVLYTVNKENQTVYIIRIVYKRRDWQNLL